MALQTEFGYLPEHREFVVGDINIRTLPSFDKAVGEMRECPQVADDWVYSPLMSRRPFGGANTKQLPYPARIFGLPKTHVLEHRSATDADRLHFLVWVYGFIVGIRLSDSDAGFIDATPIKAGTLTDMLWLGNSEEKALGIADEFWSKHASTGRITKGIRGIIHLLFLSETPSYLEYEEFIYLYTALETCHYVNAMAAGKSPRSGTHAERIAQLCAQYQCPIPTWAAPGPGGVVAHRNETLHEGLFFDEPFGFSLYGGDQRRKHGTQYHAELLQMRALICRLLCAILGFHDWQYIRSSVDTRQMHGLSL